MVTPPQVLRSSEKRGAIISWSHSHTIKPPFLTECRNESQFNSKTRHLPPPPPPTHHHHMMDRYLCSPERIWKMPNQDGTDAQTVNASPAALTSMQDRYHDAVRGSAQDMSSMLDQTWHFSLRQVLLSPLYARSAGPLDLHLSARRTVQPAVPLTVLSKQHHKVTHNHDIALLP